MDLDIRKLRYFAVVAEKQHFGRAAAQLYIAQPVLSRQIRALENELGCALLNRTTRHVQLTSAGAQLYKEAQGVLGTVDSAVRRVHEADRGVQRLMVGFTPGLHVADAVRAFATTHPEVEIELMQLNWWEQDAPLRDGRVDVGYLRRPFDGAGLVVETVGTERRVACLPVTHPLALHSTLTWADLADQTIMDAQARRTSTVEEKFELVASGQGIAVVPESVAQTYSRSDLAALPVVDADTVDVCIVVAEDRTEPRALEFMATAISVLDGVNSAPTLLGAS